MKKLNPFRFDVSLVTILLGNNEDEAVGISILNIQHLDQSRSLIQISFSKKGFFIVHLFYLALRFKISLV